MPKYLLLACVADEQIQCYHFNNIMRSPEHSCISEVLMSGRERSSVTNICAQNDAYLQLFSSGLWHLQ